jgi:hypothetical protein
VLTSASETLRLSGIDDDINASGRYDAVKPRVQKMDRVAEADAFRRLIATPDFVVGSVAAVTETGSIVVASGSGSQISAYSGGAGKAIWIVGAQKVVPDLDVAMKRLQDHELPPCGQGQLTGDRAQSIACSRSTPYRRVETPCCCFAKQSGFSDRIANAMIRVSRARRR